MEMLIYLLIGLLIGGLFGYFILKLTIQKNYVPKTEVDNLEKKISELQLAGATKLSKDEVSLNYVTKELYDTISSNLTTADNNLKKERDANEKHQTTILHITGQLEQKISKTEVEQNYVTKELYDAIASNLTTANNNLQKEREANEKHQATILRITGELEQKLSKAEVEQNYVTKELYDAIASNLATANNNLQKERETNEKHQASILRITGELEQKLSKAEVEQNYVAKESFEIVNRKLDSAEEDLEKKDATILEFSNQLTELQKKEEFLNEKLENQKNEIEEFRKTSLLEFENIANRVLKTKTSEFTEANKTNIEAILKPLGEDINKFKTKVEEVYDKESKQRFSLEEKVKELVEQTNKVSDEANNLATALKGQSKKQGNWGEVILESILQKSGLVKDREYFLQPTIKDEDGKSLRPDVLVKLPDNRVIIIDSKVSLVAYDRFSSADTLDDQKIQLAEHLKSIYGHIDGLYGKKYDNLEASLDFTMMFVPIEPAYLISIQTDQDLWAYAYSKRILLISPTNLIACLKLMADLWKREMQSKNAMEIVKRGDLIYEKLVTFVSTIEDVGKHINKTQQSYTAAIGQLNSGSGHLIGQAIKLKNLGLKSNKEIPNAMLPTDFEPELIIKPKLSDENNNEPLTLHLQK